MRMPGRFRRSGCGSFRCRLCGPNDDTIKRWRKRVEQRDVATEIAEAAAEFGPDAAGWAELAIPAALENWPAE